MAVGKQWVGRSLLLLSLGVGVLSLDLWTKTRFEKVKVLKHFWRSTGLSPSGEGPESRASFLLSDDESLNLELIGALPNDAIQTIRIHWLLDLVTVSDHGSENPSFHFENLDEMIKRLHRNGLTLIFELMGNPSNYFKDFRRQSNQWASLLGQMLRRYIGFYGSDYVGRWKFELTNEPDLRQYAFFNFSLEQYLAYFRASEKALGGLAGPAGLFRNKKNHPLCWGFLDFCNSNPCNLTMITFHRKGGGAGSQVVAKGLDLITAFMSEFPNLKGVPFGNDEADILTGWHKPLEWRGDVRYAALVVEVIIGHIQEMFVERNIPLEMLSNDNAFLSFSPNYFIQRTLLARFQMNNTRPPHVQFFRKPVYSVMGMLSLLGDQLKDIRYRPGNGGFSYLLTSRERQDTFLGVVTDGRVENDTRGGEMPGGVRVKIGLGSPTLSGISVGYLMDNSKNNPYGVWRDGGSPDFPDAGLRRRMRKAEGFSRVFIRKVKPRQTHFKFVLKKVFIPSVLAVNVCYEGIEKPGRVTDFRYVNVTHSEILLFWKDDSVGSRCILTYVVELRKAGDSHFRRINKMDSIFLFHHHEGIGANGSAVGVAGDYRVAAVDYWNRSGPFSDVLTVPG